MTPRISASQYADFLATEYLSEFICEGGAAVKVAIVPDDITASELTNAVSERAKNMKICPVHVSAMATKVHLIQQLFFAVASKLDWVTLARAVVHRIARENWGDQAAGRTTLGDMATAMEIDRQMVQTQVHRSLSKVVMDDYLLAKDFRIAMSEICQSELQPEAYTEQGREAILQWLRGELRLISAVKDKNIFHKIGRHSARAMLSSAARWIAKSGEGGLLVLLDIRQVGVLRRSDVMEGQFYYTPAMAMDVYEVLRQFIDATDEMQNFMLLVIAPDELLDDTTNRGFPKYQALKNRIWDDVRDRDRANPVAPMVRIASIGGGHP